MSETLDMFATPAAAQANEKYDPFKEDVVVELQPPIAVFLNGNGGVTIMQDQTAYMGADDVMIVLQSHQAVTAVITALQQKLEDM